MRRLLLVLLLTALLPASAQAASVVGGREADESEYPYAVYFTPGVFACGGTLVDSNWVLTAAHCADSLVLVDEAPALEWPPFTMTAYVGSNEAAGGDPVDVRRAIIHPDYDKSNSQYDVALVELAESVDLPTVKVAGPGEEALSRPGVMSTIIGWGDTEEGDGAGSQRLREAEVPVVSDADCASAYEDLSFIEYSASIHLCAGFLGKGGVDTCQGDSGGPLLVPAPDGAFRVAGVTSTGRGCARPEYPGVYTEVANAALRPFIAEHVPAAIAAPVTSDPAPTPAPAPSGGGTSTPPTSQPPPPSGSGTGTTQSDGKRAHKAKKKPRSCRKAKKAKSAKKAKKLRKKCRKAKKRQRQRARG